MSPSFFRKPCDDRNEFNEFSSTASMYFTVSPTYLTSPAVCPEETAFSNSFLAFSFSFTCPTYTRPSISLRETKTYRGRPQCRQSQNHRVITDMLKLLMKAVLGNSTLNAISWEVFALFRAFEVMTVRAKRDVTVQSTVTLYTSTIWEDGKKEIWHHCWLMSDMNTKSETSL